MTLKNKLHSTIFLLCSLTYIANSQQTPIFSDYNYNALLLNPAHSGLYSDAEIILSSQGIGNSIVGSPKTQSITYNTSLNRDKIGLGGGVLSDKIGVTNTTNIFASYAYKIHLGKDYYQPRWYAANPHVISLGLKVGVLSYKDDLLELGIPNDPEFDENIQSTIPMIGIGFLYNRRDLYLGISTTNVLGNTLASEKNIRLNSAYYAYFGYHYFADKIHEVVIKPNTLVKYEEGAPLQLDLNVLITYKQKIEGGIGYRSTSMFNILSSFYVTNNLRFTYSYHHRINNTPFSNTHGFSLGYRFGKGYNPENL